MGAAAAGAGPICDVIGAELMTSGGATFVADCGRKGGVVTASGVGLTVGVGPVDRSTAVGEGGAEDICDR